MKKLLLLLTLLIGNLLPVVANEQSYSIVFKNDASDQTTAAKNDQLLNEITEGIEYVSSFSDISRVYVGETGLKFGASSGGGYVTINLSEAGKVEATGIKVEFEKYSNDALGLTVSINGGSALNLTSGEILSLEKQEINSLKFTSTKRLYLKSITIYYESDDERIDPSFTWSTDEITVEYSENGKNVFELPHIINNIHNLSLTYASDNEAVATIDPVTGEVTVLGIGSAQISAKFVGNDEYKTKSDAYTLIVAPSRAEGFVYGDLTPAIFGHTSTNYGEEIYTSELKTLITYKSTYGCNSGNFTFNLGNTKGGENSGIVVTENPLRLVLTSVLVKGGNSNRNLGVYGSDKAFESTTPEWDNYTLIGTVGDVNDDVDVEIVPEDDYEYAAIWPAKGNNNSMQFTSVTLIWKEPEYNVSAEASVTAGGISATFNLLVGNEVLSAEAMEHFKVYVLDSEGNKAEEIGTAGVVINNISEDPCGVYAIESPITQRLFEVKAADIANWPVVGDNAPATPSVLVDNVAVESPEDGIEVNYGSTVTFVSTYATYIVVNDEVFEGNQYSVVIENTDTYTVQGKNENGVSEAVDFDILLADPIISVTYADGTVENNGEYNVLVGTVFNVRATGYKTLTVTDANGDEVILSEGTFTPAVGTTPYTVSASNGENTVELTFTVNVEKILESVFNFANGAVYGMEVLSGQTSEYANNPTICKEVPVTLELSGDNGFRLWSVSNGSELRAYKSAVLTFTIVPGYEIVKIDIVGDLGSNLQVQEGSAGEFSAGTWTGNSKKVVLVPTYTSSNKKASSITVTYKEVLTPVVTSKVAVVEDQNCNTLSLDFKFVKGEELVEVEDADQYKVYFNNNEIGDASETISNLPYAENAAWTIRKDGEIIAEVENPWKDVLSSTAKVVNPVYTVYTDKAEAGMGHVSASFNLDVETNLDSYFVDFYFENEAGEQLYELEFTFDNGIEGVNSTAHLTWKDNKPFCEIHNLAVVDATNPDYSNINFGIKVVPTFPFLMTNVAAPAAAAQRAPRAAEPVVNYVSATATAISHEHMTNAKSEVSGVADVVVDGESVVEFYNLQGVKVEGELAPGLYIRRQGNAATKVVVK